METNNRKFSIDGLGEFMLVEPSAEAIRKSDWFYSKTYNQALLDDITTAGEMMEILKSRGIIGEDYDKSGDELKVKIGEKIVEMETELDRDKRKALAIEVSKLRQELFAHNQRLNGPMSNTCEQMSEDARLDFITSCIVSKLDGSKVWKSYDDYMKEQNRAFALKARLEVLLYMQGLDPDFLDRVPENVVMQSILTEESEEAEAADKNTGEVEEVVEDISVLPAEKISKRGRKTKEVK